MDLGLTDKVAFVTGSSRGIGRATAHLFAREGAHVVVTYRRDRFEAEQTATAVRKAGREALVVEFDLASRLSIESAITAAIRHFGTVDVLVNNAVDRGSGREPPPRFEHMPEAEWREPLRANVEGYIAAIQATLAGMRERRWGRIVNVSSDLAVEGVAGTAWYATAKAALHGLTQSLAAELADVGVLVNVVMPATTLTERLRDTYGMHDAPLGEIALARPFLLPPDVASVIVYLCSEANRALSGQVVRVGKRPGGAA